MGSRGKPKPGKDLETIVAKMERAFGRTRNVAIQAPGYLVDRTTGARREHDVLLTDIRGHHVIVTAIECRDRSRKVGVPEVEAFAAKCRDTRVDRAIIVSAKGFAATALKKAAHENMGCLLLQAGGEALMRQSGLVIGRSVFVMETKHKLVIGAPIAARNESVQVRDTAGQVDFTAEIRRCVELFLSLPHTGSPDSGGEVWYRIPCDTMYLRNQVTGVDYKIRHVACVVWCEWTEEPMVQRTVTYSDLLNNSVIATATTIDLPDVGTLTISVPSSAPLKPVVAETQRRKSAKRA